MDGWIDELIGLIGLIRLIGLILWEFGRPLHLEGSHFFFEQLIWQEERPFFLGGFFPEKTSDYCRWWQLKDVSGNFHLESLRKMMIQVDGSHIFQMGWLNHRK